MPFFLDRWILFLDDQNLRSTRPMDEWNEKKVFCLASMWFLVGVNLHPVVYRIWEIKKKTCPLILRLRWKWNATRFVRGGMHPANHYIYCWRALVRQHSIWESLLLPNIIIISIEKSFFGCQIEGMHTGFYLYITSHSFICIHMNSGREVYWLQGNSLSMLASKINSRAME